MKLVQVSILPLREKKSGKVFKKMLSVLSLANLFEDLIGWYLKTVESAKNRPSNIIESQRRLQNSKKVVLSQATLMLLGSSDSSSDEEIEEGFQIDASNTASDWLKNTTTRGSEE